MKTSVKKLLVVVFAIGFVAQVAWAADTELRFSWWGGDTRHKPTLEAIKLFEAANPGVKIKAEYMGWGGYTERLATQISGANEPDITQINWAWISTMFSKKGDGFYDLYKAKDVLKLDEWGPNINYGVRNGKLNAIPVSFTSRFYLWQKNTLEKVGIAIPKNWDELFAAGKAFEKLGPEYYPIDGVYYDVFLMSHAYLMQKTGKQWIDPDTDTVILTKAEALDWVKFYKKLSETRAVVPHKLRLSIAPPEAPTEQQQQWVTGQWAGNYTWDSTFKVRMSSLPKTTACDLGEFLSIPNPKNIGFFARPTMMFAVSRNSKNPIIGAKFINFLLTDPDAVKVLSNTRGIPMAKSSYDLLAKEGLFTDLDMKALAQLKKAKIDPPSAWLESARIQELLRSIFETVSLGKSTDEEAVDRLINETNQVLKSIQ